ncbi:major capsid protein P2 [Pseudoalteromonas gelatinilytica]
MSKLPSITGVEPGNTVSLDVPAGLTYDKIHFKYSDAT